MTQEVGFKEDDASDIQDLLQADNESYTYEDFWELKESKASSLDNNDETLSWPVLTRDILSKSPRETILILRRLSQKDSNTNRE